MKCITTCRGGKKERTNEKTSERTNEREATEKATERANERKGQTRGTWCRIERRGGLAGCWYWSCVCVCALVRGVLADDDGVRIVP